MDKNYAIGKNGKLPWHYSADLKFFKKITTGNVVVMGTNTYRSIGRPLSDRLNIVVSRSGHEGIPSEVMRLDSVDEVITFSKYIYRNVYIIGGAETFSAFSDHIEQWIVTFVPMVVEDADIFMPDDFLDGFAVEETIDLGEGLEVKCLHRELN
jgi:dihydrofolate reductase